jgi:2'-5' RNA ligase
VLRVFIAIQLSVDLKRQISELQAELKRRIPESRGLSWVNPEGIHLTLRFLGDMDESQIEPIARVLRKAASAVGTFKLEARGVSGFPTPARARVLWVGLSGDAEAISALQQLQATIEDGVVDIGFAKEDRVFTPHLTLARIRERGAAGAVAGILMKEVNRVVGEFRAESV